MDIGDELIPGLPEEIALECLTRSHFTTHRVAARVSRRWHRLFLSRHFYNLRKLSGRTHKAVFAVQSLLQPVSDEAKSAAPIAFGVSAFDPATGNWTRIKPIEKYPNGLPLFCRIIGVDGKLAVIGGWDPVSYRPVEDVFVYEFAAEKWRQGKGMPEKRSFFGATEYGGEIFVAGGHDEGKNAAASAWVYNIRNDEWRELPAMSRGRDECEAVAIGSEIWVVSGYETENQGNFERTAEVYETKTGKWRRVESAWCEERSPRNVVGVGREGELFNWATAAAAAKTTAVTGEGIVGVNMEEKAIVFMGRNGVFMGECQNGKLERIELPEEFSGFVQSACYTHI
ncbi:F-box/kelch-repeat protein At2g44130 [Cucumis sativus]|nr:F-box/kelch-repeat protein At2g44130 [Cucumis sativus]